MPRSKVTVLSLVDETLISPEADAKIRAGLCVCFPRDVDVFSRTRAWHGSTPEFSVVLEETDRVVAHLGVVRRTITAGQGPLEDVARDGVSSHLPVGRTIALGQVPLAVAGVQNVFVLPEYRGRGLAVRVLEAAMVEARSRDFDCGLLFCVSALEPLYARAGWYNLGARQIIRIEEGRELPLPGQNITMFYPLRVAGFPEGVVHLCGNDW